MSARLSASLLTMAMLAACSPSNPSPDASANDANSSMPDASANDAMATEDAAQDAAMAFFTLNDCAEAEYVDLTDATAMRTVVPMGSTGYTPRCFTIRAGQSVTFSMDFTMHPLQPGIAHGSSTGASSPNPIQAQTTGSSYMVTFANPGFFPFKCNIHQHVGMAGVVRVLPAM